MYEAGDGVSRNDAQALTWLRRAVDDGMPLAEARLGIKYANGDGVKQSPSDAERLLDSAAGKGVSSAEIALGRIYAKGLAVPPDVIRRIWPWPISGSTSPLATRPLSRTAMWR